MYSKDIMQSVRQNLGLEEDDTSRDEEINKMSKSEIFEKRCTWEGFFGYSNEIKRWIKDIYGIELDKS